MQKRELTDILDNLQKHNFNTVMFQVRARGGEVLYNSDIEPMSLMIASRGDQVGEPLIRWLLPLKSATEGGDWNAMPGW